MKNHVIILFMISFSGFILLLYSCNKEDEKEIKLPTVVTKEATQITESSAISGGDISDNGGSNITIVGLCFSNKENPTEQDVSTQKAFTGETSYEYKLSNLLPETKYYIRSFAYNSLGINYGNQVSFVTKPLTDADGNTYKTVVIGTQVWMAENLKTTKYNDGSSINLATENFTWSIVNEIGYYCWYNNSIVNKDIFGALYNWNATKSNKLCPVGWKIPSDIDWDKLNTYLGGDSIAGGKLKEVGLANWISPNTGATNVSGFTGRPGGYRDPTGNFKRKSEVGWFWSNGILPGMYSYFYLGSGIKNAGTMWFFSGGGSNYGLSVRCKKN